MSKSDAELVAEALEGSQGAFEEIVRRHQRFVFNVIYRYLGGDHDVEDIAQDVFLRVYGSLGRFDSSKPMKPWIGRIAANRCYDELRRRRVRQTKRFADFSREDAERIQTKSHHQGQGEALSSEEAEKCLRLLQAAMASLPKKDRMAFVLREIENQSYEEVAEILGTSQGAARIRVSRARSGLKKQLEKVFNE